MRSVLLFVAASALYAQSASFEVASIKPAPPPDPHSITVGCQGGPETKIPGRWTCQNMSLKDLILMAYDIQPYQLTGPEWMGNARFQINANVPSGATKPQFRRMIQTLLKERFRLQMHSEKKEGASAYELVVAKNGPKLTEAKPRGPGEEMPKLDGRLRTGKDGLPELPKGVPIMMSSRGRVKRQAVGESMEALAGMLSRELGRPVIDRTGLIGKYDFTLVWARTGGGAQMPSHGGEGAAGPPEDLGPTLTTAIEEQLGLKLERAKGTLEIFTVDKVEKTPTEN